jgi:hypothetical protein
MGQVSGVGGQGSELMVQGLECVVWYATPKVYGLCLRVHCSEFRGWNICLHDH